VLNQTRRCLKVERYMEKKNKEKRAGSGRHQIAGFPRFPAFSPGMLPPVTRGVRCEWTNRRASRPLFLHVPHEKNIHPASCCRTQRCGVWLLPPPSIPGRPMTGLDGMLE
jgi:hypothetical protein